MLGEKALSPCERIERRIGLILAGTGATAVHDYSRARIMDIPPPLS